MKLTPLLFILLCTNFAFGQVKIGSNINTIDASSLVELESDSKVLVVSRVTTTQMNAITPLNGALVYNTDDNCLFQFNNGSWSSLCVNVSAGETVTTLADNTDGTFTYTNETGATAVISKSLLTDNGDGTYSFTNGTATTIIDTNATSNLYDNSTSGIPAANVQQAIDELSSAINIHNAADGDLSDSNELSDISISGTIINLTNPVAGATGVDLDNTFATDAELIASTDDDITGVSFDGTNLEVEEGSTNFSADLSSLEESADITAVQADVDTNEADADAAIAAVQADVDTNETDADTAIAAVQADVDANETDADAAIAAVQADIDTNEADADAAIVLKEDAANKSSDITLADATNVKFPTELAVKTYVDGQIAATADDDITGVSFDGTNLQVDEGSTNFSADLSALEESADITAVQADVDANEADADAAIAAVQADIDTNETDADTAIAAVQADVDTNEADADAAIAAVQADVDTNEADADAAIALKEDAANKSTDITLADATNVKFPTELAVKTYVDVQIAATADDDITGVSFDGTNLQVDEGSTNFSADLSALEESADIAVVQADVNANEADADAAIAAVQADIDTNEADADAAIALKEDAANKSTDVTLGTSDLLYPTQNAVKTYVDGQIAATADDDLTGVSFDGTNLQVDEGATSFSADLSTLEESADIAAVQADVDTNEVDADAAIAAVQVDVDTNEADADAAIAALQAEVDTNETDADAAIAANTTAINAHNTADGDLSATNELSDIAISGTTINLTNAAAGATGIDLDATFATDAEVALFEVTNVSDGHLIATITEPDGTSVEIDETITSLTSPVGSESTLVFTDEANGTTAIPNIVRSVNGVNPAANGNVAVVLSSVSTGLEVNLPATGIDADVYIVSGEVAPNADRNGVAFIYDDPTGWQEVTTDLATADARYVNLIGDTMTGPLAMGNNSITGVNNPVNLQDAATKNYVDTAIAANADDDITGVSFDGTSLQVDEGSTNFSADLSALEESADIAALQADVNTNEADADAAIALKEDAANKSTDITLADATNVKFPTELAVKTYVDGQIAASADDDITGVSFDGTNLQVDEGSTNFSADLSALEESADIAAVQADVDTNEADADAAIALKEDAVNKSSDITLADATNVKFPTELAVKTYVDGQIAASADDDITGVSFDGTNLQVDEGSTNFSADLSALEESADIAAVQADVDTNEADADAAIAAVQADVDTNETDADAAIAAVQADVDTNEADADAAIASNTAAITAHNTADNDLSASNEIQTLSILGNDLSISGTGGNTVTLPALAGTTGSVFFANTDGSPTENNNQVFWDATNNRLGIGTNSPTHKLQVTGQVRATSFANANGTANSPAYRFNSDSNTGMFRAATDELGFSTAGTEALRIDASGNIGIGLLVPDEALHIAGNMRLNGSFEDQDGEAGTVGQVLSATATGTDWVDANGIGTDNQNLTSSVTTANESVEIQISGGSNTTINIQDADSDSTNEIQTLSVLGNDLTISGTGGNTISLPSISETTTNLSQNVTTGVITYTNEESTPQTANIVGAETDNSITSGANGGAYFESPIKAFGKISATGGTTRVTSGITVTKLGTGRYRVNLPAGLVSDEHYIIQLSQPGRGGSGNDDPGISYNSQTASSFEVIIGDNDNGGTDRSRYDSEFMFTVLDL